MDDPVEVHTRYSTTTDDLASAWAFVMSKIDLLGPDPAVEITPLWEIRSDEEDPPRRFSVTVSGGVIED